MRKYPSDLTDRQWQVMQKILEDDRKREDPLHRVLDASLYVAKSGCQWRMLPKGHPCWQSVHHHFRKWERDGLVEHIHDALCRMVRQANGKSALPSVGIMDGQSAKRSALARQGCGHDGGKETMGRKRHIATDTLGPLLVVVTHPANVYHSVGAKQVMAALRAKSLSGGVPEGLGGPPLWVGALHRRADRPRQVQGAAKAMGRRADLRMDIIPAKNLQGP